MPAKKKASVVVTERYAPKDVKIKKRLGGGVLKELVIRQVPSGNVTHYALAYINPAIFSGDDGRVLGYDNSHGYSHKHHLGVVTPEPFTSYQQIYDRFQAEWMAIAIAYVNKGK